MRFPLSWLKDWVEVPAELTDLSALLMRSGVGLEAVEDGGAALKNVVVAEVLERAPHPNADKLSLCRVSDGARTFSIVCGAPNVAAGIRVPLAKEGAELPGNFKIKRSKIRGVESEGMLCSSGELGLPEGVDGLLILPAEAPLGLPLASWLGLDDPVLTLETTANRPDHLSIRGLAREVAALGGLPAKSVDPRPLPEPSGAGNFSVRADPQACVYYSVREISGVRIAPSPDWLKLRLERAGIRSINNVVDATNHVLLEYGQPMHAFDADRITGGVLEARLARSGECIVTLDGQNRELKDTDIVIADGRAPQAIGGVMGGAESEVTPDTTRILLEAAVFPPKLVRRTSRRLGLSSESSQRFERGVDARAVDEAMDACAALVLELAGGSLSGGRQSSGSPAEAPLAVDAQASRINAMLGTSIPAKEMTQLLTRRYFSVRPIDEDTFEAVPPAWRRDVRSWVDLAEDVVQMAGIDSVPSTTLDEVRTPDQDDAWWRNALMLRHRLSGLGLAEAGTLSYLDPELLKAWGMIEIAPSIDNPLSVEQSRLRPSLLPGLVASALAALKRRQFSAAFFECGRVFISGPKGLLERERVAAVLAGKAEPGQWNAPTRDWDFYDLKGRLEALGRGLDVVVRASQCPASETPGWAHPGRCAAISVGGLIGHAAALHPSLLNALDAPKGLEHVFVFELEYLAPNKALGKEPRYAAFPRVPSVERDLSCLMDTGLEAGKIVDFLKNEAGLGAARVLDRFEGAPLPPGRKSLTFRVTYAGEERTLTDDEVNLRHEDVLRRLETALPVEIRR
jgi:phenylalanyl-tRNA synthetase beta chain